MDVDEVADADVAGPSTGAVGVEVGDDVGGASHVVVAADTAAEPHPAVDGAQHQDHTARLAARRERLVHAEVARVYNSLVIISNHKSRFLSKLALVDNSFIKYTTYV